MSIRLAVCISGGGTTLQNLIDRIADGRLDASIVLVVSSRAGAFGIERAHRAGLPVCVVPAKGRAVAAFSQEVFDACRRAGADLVLLAGFLCLLEIPPDFVGKVMNIHPALLPAYGGKGFYGERVHRAVLDAGEKVSGCTVHFVDNEYDAGPVILQRTVPVLEGDDPASLAARVFRAECEAFPEAIRLFAEGRVRLAGGSTVFEEESNGREGNQ